VRTQLRPLRGQSLAGGIAGHVATGEHQLPGECSEAGLSGIRPGQRRLRGGVRPPVCWPWEREWELVSGKKLAAEGALQDFGLVKEVAGRQDLGAQMGALVGAQSGRALSHGILKGPATRLEGATRAQFGTSGLIDPAPCGDCAV